MSRSKFVDEAVSDWSRIRPEINLTAMEAIQRLVWSGRLAEDILERTAIASGLRRRGDYEVLAVLRRAQPALLTPVEVAQQLQTSPSGMTGKLDRLEEQGLIKRTQDPDDRRAIRLDITDTGQTVISDAFDSSITVYQAMLADFTPNEARSLDALLNKVLTRLDELSERSQP
ncbi:MAG: MarR family transcriptional regulator [Acidimicrobiia bacterium]|nr:MarR family transcriptional regulator [Acidimicrobiia bacterium]